MTDQHYWEEQALFDAQDPNKLGFITPTFVHYRIGEEGRQWARGFNGLAFRVTFRDGRVVETKNLWIHGRVPEEFQHLFKIEASVEEIR